MLLDPMQVAREKYFDNNPEEVGINAFKAGWEARGEYENLP